MTRQISEIVRRLFGTRAAWPMLLAIALLCTAGVMAINIVNPPLASDQQRRIAIGGLCLFLVLVPHYQWIARLGFPIFAAVLILLVAVLFTARINGAKRWFAVFGGPQLQPSELAKIAFIFALAWYLRYRKDVRTWGGLVIPFAMMIVPCVLVLAEPDLGTALLFPAILYAMLIAAGARLRQLAIIAIIALGLFSFAYGHLKDYQKRRVESWMQLINAAPDSPPQQGDGYQQMQSMIAIGSGGWLGNAASRHNIAKGMLPEAHTDFIFAVIGSQWGFVGCGIVLLMYIGFLGAAMEIAASTKEPFGRMLVVGLATLVLWQAAINVAMTIALGPVVGIELPFVSYGGSAMLANMIAAGLMLNVSIRRNTRMSTLPSSFAAA